MVQFANTLDLLVTLEHSTPPYDTFHVIETFCPKMSLGSLPSGHGTLKWVLVPLNPYLCVWRPDVTFTGRYPDMSIILEILLSSTARCGGQVMLGAAI